MNDALIGESSLCEECILITGDKDLKKRMLRIKDDSYIEYKDFKNELQTKIVKVN